MHPILTRCGYRCDLCLAYKPNVEANLANQQKFSAMAGINILAFACRQRAICCDSCMADEPKLIDQNCPVRSCVIEKGGWTLCSASNMCARS